MDIGGDALKTETDFPLHFGALREEDLDALFAWRSATPGAWRDPIATTIVKHRQWYEGTVSYEDWIRGVYDADGCFIAQTQLHPIDWHNKSAEIGLIVNPIMRRKGLGREIVQDTLHYGFRNLGLNTIWGEVYKCTDAWLFWTKVCPNMTTMPQRKCWDGMVWDSIYFWWTAGEWGREWWERE